MTSPAPSSRSNAVQKFGLNPMNDPNLSPSMSQKMEVNVELLSCGSSKEDASTIALEHFSRLTEEIQVAEEQLDIRKKQLLAWKTRFNGMRDVSRLPDEILLQIWSYPARQAYESPQKQRSWLAVTQVCAWWRQLTLGTQSLWRSPYIMFPELASYLIERAGSWPLVLYINCKDSAMGMDNWITDTFSLACRLLCRADTLVLNWDHTYYPEDHPAYLEFLDQLNRGGPFPKLEWITIDFEVFPPSSGKQLSIVELVRSTPKLRALDLTNQGLLPVTEPLDRLVQLPQLTHLEVNLGRSEPDDERGAPLRRMLSALTLLPNLQRLILFSAFSPCSQLNHEWVMQGTTPVVMSSLRELCIGCDIDELEFFFSHISHPFTTWVQVEIPWGMLNDDFLPSLRTFLGMLTSSPHRGGPIRYLDIREVERTLFSAEQHLLAFHSEIDRQRRPLGLFWPSFHWLSLHHVPEMCRLECLERLDYGLNSSEMEMWTAFGRLPNLKIVQVVGLERHPALIKVLSIFGFAWWKHLRPSRNRRTLLAPTILPSPPFHSTVRIVSHSRGSGEGHGQPVMCQTYYWDATG